MEEAGEETAGVTKKKPFVRAFRCGNAQKRTRTSMRAESRSSWVSGSTGAPWGTGSSRSEHAGRWRHKSQPVLDRMLPADSQLLRRTRVRPEYTGGGKFDTSTSSAISRHHHLISSQTLCSSALRPRHWSQVSCEMLMAFIDESGDRLSEERP